MIVEDETRREPIRENFPLCNADALSVYYGENAARYVRLKFEGPKAEPEDLAMFAGSATES